MIFDDAIRARFGRLFKMTHFGSKIKGHKTDKLEDIIPIGSMGLVYLPTFTMKINQM